MSRERKAEGGEQKAGGWRQKAVCGYTFGMADKEKPKRWALGGSIGDVSIRLNFDVREIWMSGYSDEQINDVLIGEYTLDELWKREPLGNDRTPFGREILAKRARGEK